MEQFGSVDEYFSRFLPYSKRFDNSTSLKLFLTGLAPYIHIEIVFDDPKSLCDAFQLAKFYEGQWMNPLIHNIQEEALNPAFQANSESRLKLSATNLEDPDRAIGGGSPTPVRSGAEDGAVAKGKVDADLVPSESEDAVTTRGANEAISLSRGSIFDDSAATKSDRTLGSESHTEDGAASNAKVGAPTKGKWTDAIATATVGGLSLRARQLRRFFLLKSPPLLAIVLRWNRGCERQEWSQNAGKGSAEAWQGENAPGVGASGSRMQAG
ncbi:hypothetical protein PIB30_047054 [Stylosanthes scabra]|uniref:Uncharacterized protein n=1 Tax=Stylosanthes scabra TaxID=79078 RepID=A0ABU6TGD0_9FABA|nr:hypothetical protein [Stylosanthes scabra]